MTEARLAEIEAAHPHSRVFRELCTALREAWSERDHAWEMQEETAVDAEETENDRLETLIAQRRAERERDAALDRALAAESSCAAMRDALVGYTRVPILAAGDMDSRCQGDNIEACFARAQTALASDSGAKLLAYVEALERAAAAVPRPSEGRCELLDAVEKAKKECGR